MWGAKAERQRAKRRSKARKFRASRSMAARSLRRSGAALDMKCPAELYLVSLRLYDGLPELTYPFHDRELLVTACGRLCLHRKRINLGCHPCLRYDLLPMSPGWTNRTW
jgi:hypothetical protein